MEGFDIFLIFSCVIAIFLTLVIAIVIPGQSTGNLLKTQQEITKLIDSIGMFPKKTKVLKVIRKNYEINVLKIRVKDLDKSKCSNKFLSNNLDGDSFVYVKCDENGNIEYRGNKAEYRIYSIEDHQLVK